VETLTRSIFCSEAKQQVREVIRNHFKYKKSPLFLHPEGATTNGNGLLMFNKFVFGLNLDVQPAALRIINPIQLPFRVDHLRDDLVSNLFFIFFNPFLIYEYTMLPIQVREQKKKKNFR
jgi:hypothetical protein